jgi:hypothetical protein
MPDKHFRGWPHICLSPGSGPLRRVRGEKALDRWPVARSNAGG